MALRRAANDSLICAARMARIMSTGKPEARNRARCFARSLESRSTHVFASMTGLASPALPAAVAALPLDPTEWGAAAFGCARTSHAKAALAVSEATSRKVVSGFIGLARRGIARLDRTGTHAAIGTDDDAHSSV